MIAMSSVDELLELNPPHKNEWKDSEYAVYFYTPNRLCIAIDTS